MCGSVDPSSVQAGVILRTLINCGVHGHTGMSVMLEQIQGSLIGSIGPPKPPKIQEGLYCDSVIGLRRIINSISALSGAGENGMNGMNAMRRLLRSRIGGGDFVKFFPDLGNLPGAERRTSAEVDMMFAEDVEDRIKVGKALFQHVEDFVADAFRTTVVTSSSSSEGAISVGAAKQQNVVVSRNLQGIEKALLGWQDFTEGLLCREQ